MYSIGQDVVHPLHGAGVIGDIFRKTENGCLKKYYVLLFSDDGMSVTLPEEKCTEVGLRPVIGKLEADRIFKAIPGIETQEGEGNWNKRYRENMQRIKSGDPLLVASVVKNLMRRDRDRGLSTGERRMLHFAKDILVSEMTVSLRLPSDIVENKLAIAVE